MEHIFWEGEKRDVTEVKNSKTARCFKPVLAKADHNAALLTYSWDARFK